jgi:hypothetical protein
MANDEQLREHARLGFHQARLGNYNGAPPPQATKAMFDSYPADIRGWLNAKGGLDQMPLRGILDDAGARPVADGLPEVCY